MCGRSASCCSRVVETVIGVAVALAALAIARARRR
jgi:hypothetical protein